MSHDQAGTSPRSAPSPIRILQLSLGNTMVRCTTILRPVLPNTQSDKAQAQADFRRISQYKNVWGSTIYDNYGDGSCKSLYCSCQLRVTDVKPGIDVSLIHRIPPEVLGLIFEYCCEKLDEEVIYGWFSSAGPSVMSSKSSPLVVSRVCRS